MDLVLVAQVEVDLGVEVLVLAQVARAHTHRPPRHCRYHRRDFAPRMRREIVAQGNG